MFIIDDIISELVSSSLEAVKEKFTHNPRFIKLLERFNLKPDEPPKDFQGVYIYTLLEYGAGKPKAILELFGKPEIQDAFSQAFEQDDPNIFLQKGEDYIESYALGDEIKTQGIDHRREFAEFSLMFFEVAKRVRTPDEVLLAHQVTNLQESLAEMRSQLQQINSLEEMRSQLQQLVGSYQQLLPAATPKSETVLARELREWFATLGYRFESYEVVEEEYFEWIINIPARRGYDRILVRGVDGEAGIKDINEVREVVETNKTDEGWIIAPRRVSRAARNEVKKEENRSIFCYTFDELLDDVADFNGYFKWLENEVKSRKVDATYVPLACTKEEVDPDTHQRIGTSRYEEEDGWIDGYIDMWLDDPTKEHISILGEFGTGKTWFTLHYAWTALEEYLEAKRRRIERPRLPLVIPLRDYAKAVTVESLFSEFFFRKHEIGLPGYSAFEQLNRMGKLLLIFDGFDEMAARVDRQAMVNNFWELAKVVVPGAKAILTCRTEHFPEAKEGRRLLNAELQASTSNLTGEPPQFEVLELEKFTDEQIRRVLSFQTDAETVEEVMGNEQLLDLARRPVMIELILEALPEIEAGAAIDIARIYLYAIRRKMERDIKTERTFTSLEDKLYFLCELSWEMLSTDRMSLNYKEFPDRIRRCFGAEVQEQKDLDHWHYDMMGQTMLVRNAEGDYYPAHRSLLEFFVAFKFAAELGVLATDFAEIGDLSRFSGRSLLRESFGKMPLAKAVIDLILPMLEFGEETKEKLLDVVRETRGKTVEEVGYLGGNAVTLLLKCDRFSLEGLDLSGCVLVGADFTNVSLYNVNFACANLSNSIFSENISSIRSIVFSPNKHLLVVGDYDGMLHFFRLSDFAKVFYFRAHYTGIRTLAFSPDGLILASGGYDNTIKLWDVYGKCLKQLEGHTDWISSIAFSPNGKILASGSDDNTIKLWNPYTAQLIVTLEKHKGFVNCISFSLDGKILASCSNDRQVCLWDTQTYKCLKCFEPHEKEVSSIAFNLNSKYLATGGADYQVKLWKISNFGEFQSLVTFVGHTNRVNSVIFSMKRKLLVSSSDDKTIKIWNLETEECIKTFEEHSSWIRSLALNPNGDTIASSDDDQTLKLWDIQNISHGKCLKTWQGHTGWIYSVSFSPQGHVLASASADRTIRLWDIQHSKCYKTLSGHSNSVRVVSFNHDGTILASGGDDCSVKLWNFYTGKCIATLNEHKNWVYSVVFSPRSNILASASDDLTVRLWNVENGQCLNTFEGYSRRIRSLCFNSNGSILAVGSRDSTIQLWNVKLGKCITTLNGHKGEINSIKFSSTDQILASSSDDRTICFWNIQNGKCIAILKGHNAWVYSIIFSHDDRIMASSSHDNTIRLWDVNKFTCIAVLEEHNSWIYSIAFNSDSSILASGSGDQTIKIWDMKTYQCIKTLRHPQPYEDMNITGVQGLTDAEKVTLKTLGAVEHP